MPLKTTAGNHGAAAKGRGATINPEGRFESVRREAHDDGWFQEPPDEPSRPKTIIAIERAKSIITRNDSPDIGFSQSLNPYRGCQIGCPFCYSRPNHGYLGLSPGLDWETRISAKTNAPELLREELARPGYRCENLVIGVATDAYQPTEKELRITRGILEVCAEANQPIGLITKSALIERDIDILAPMARKNLVSTTITITTLNHEISRYLEPRASAPTRRLLAIERMAAAGIPVNVNVAPVVPFLTDSELEAILEASAKAGVTSAAYTLLRLPWEVKDIFKAWLEEHFPLKAAHVMSRVHQMRGGKDNDPNFGSRRKGQGLFAELLNQRFHKACERLGLNQRETAFDLDTTLFRPPAPQGQGTLF